MTPYYRRRPVGVSYIDFSPGPARALHRQQPRVVHGIVWTRATAEYQQMLLAELDLRLAVSRMWHQVGRALLVPAVSLQVQAPDVIGTTSK